MSNIEETEAPKVTGKDKGNKAEKKPDALNMEVFEGIDWKGTANTVGEWLDLLFSGLSGIFSKNPEKYKFEQKYKKLTGENWTKPLPVPGTVKPEGLKESWDKLSHPTIYSRPDGTTTDHETGDVLKAGEEHAKREEAALKAMEKGQVGKDALKYTTPGTPSAAENAAKKGNEDFKSAAGNTENPSSTQQKTPTPEPETPTPVSQT